MKNHATSSLQDPKIQKNVFTVRLSKGYTCLRPPIVNKVLRLFWGFKHLYTNSGSWDMEKHAILPWQGPKIKKLFLRHLRLSEGYAYLRPPTVNHVLHSFWAVIQKTVEHSRNMSIHSYVVELIQPLDYVTFSFDVCTNSTSSTGWNLNLIVKISMLLLLSSETFSNNE